MKNETTPSILGQNTLRLRQRLGLNQEQLAQRIGVSRSIITRLERGRVRAIASDKLCSLAEVLGVDCNQLLHPFEGKELAERPHGIERVIRRIRSRAFGQPSIDRVLEVVGYELVYGGVSRSACLGVVVDDVTLEERRGFVNADERDDLRPGQPVLDLGALSRRRLPLDDPESGVAQAVYQGKTIVLGGFGMRLWGSREEAQQKSGDYNPLEKVAFFVPIQWADRTVGVLMTACRPERQQEIGHRFERLEPLLADVGLALTLLLAKQPAGDQDYRRRRAIEQVYAGVRRVVHIEELADFLLTMERYAQDFFPETVGLGVTLLREHDNQFIQVACSEGRTRLRRWKGMEEIVSPDGLGVLECWHTGKVYARSADQLRVVRRRDVAREEGVYSSEATEAMGYVIDVPFVFGTLSMSLRHAAQVESITAFLQEVGRWLEFVLQSAWTIEKDHGFHIHTYQGFLSDIGAALSNMGRLEDLSRMLPLLYGYLHQRFPGVVGVSVHLIQEEPPRCRSFGLVGGLYPEVSEWVPLRRMAWAEGEAYLNHWRTQTIFERVPIEEMLEWESPFGYHREKDKDINYTPVKLIDVPFRMGMLGVGLSTYQDAGAVTLLQQVGLLIDLAVRRFL